MNVILEINGKYTAFSELDAKLLYADIKASPQKVMFDHELDEGGLRMLHFQLVEAFEAVKRKTLETGNITDIIQLKG